MPMPSVDDQNGPSGRRRPESLPLSNLSSCTFTHDGVSIQSMVPMAVAQDLSDIQRASRSVAEVVDVAVVQNKVALFAV